MQNAHSETDTPTNQEDGALPPLETNAADRLGDFTSTPRIIFISLIAIGIGAISAVVALVLLRLIGLFTNLFFFQRWGTALVSPAGNHLGVFVVLVPVIGALIIGLMARYGSERIRGHGIPEAIEAILINGSRVEPKVAMLKPISSAISIGSGGPFGAEGPIIMTGGAFGSMIAQFFHLTSAERKTLLVAGAAARHVGHVRRAGGGGAARRRAAALRVEAAQRHPGRARQRDRRRAPALSARHGAALPDAAASRISIGPAALLGCVVVGLLAGGLSALLTAMVYAAEDAFQRLPIHWMWWPAIGGLVIGIGGLIFPQALGVGYDTIGALLQGNVAAGVIHRRPGGEVAHLVRLARLRHLGRRARAAADDGRRARRRGGDVPAARRGAGSGRWSAWARSSAARCARRSPASSSRSN